MNNSKSQYYFNNYYISSNLGYKAAALEYFSKYVEALFDELCLNTI